MDELLPSYCGLSEEELKQRMESNQPPDTPEEYLARVVLQDKSAPCIVSACSIAIKPQQEQKRPTTRSNWMIPTQPAKMTIPIELETRFDSLLKEFIRIRNELEYWEIRLVDTGIEERRNGSMFHRVEFPVSLERMQWIDFFTNTMPLMHVLLQMDNVDVVRGLKHYAKAFSLSEELLAEAKHSAWVFALLARLDVPYTDDVASSLAQMLRTVASSSSSNDLISNDDELAPGAVIRFLLERYFHA